ncbi:MAG: arginine--tRNA ligase [Bacteroidia bacterium]
MHELRIENILIERTLEAIKKLYEQSVSPNQITFQKTKVEFEGDITLLVFPLVKASKRSPEETANAIGKYLKENASEIISFNVVKGFLNLVIADDYWVKYLLKPEARSEKPEASSETVMVEFSSPNTNKPLHLGHIRNNLLGFSISEILKAAGKKVIRVNLVNDRGIHICKSMLAWKGYAKGETPESSGMKGDHLVGKYYVRFEEIYKEQVGQIEQFSKDFLYALIERKQSANISEEVYRGEIEKKIMQLCVYFQLFSWRKANEIKFDLPNFSVFADSYNDFLNKLEQDDKEFIDRYSKELLQSVQKLPFNNPESIEFKLQLTKIYKDYAPLVYSAHELLRRWEAGDQNVIALWKKMNGWVYDGFAQTYKELGIEFEKTYYESETYLLGKEIVEEGLKKNVFKKKEDGSVWIDLTADRLDEKLLLRSDGTSVYMTQDLGTAIKRQEEFNFNRLVYVVGNEQDYHFKVLFLILKKLGYEWAKDLFHLSYGMVDLPSGKMKSREGTVVDADELMDEMVNTARETTKALGKTEGMSEIEAENLYHSIGLGALKYFILKVDPKKRMLFDPKESIDFNGNTGPFIQYTYARIKSVLRKAEENQPLAINHQPLSALNKKEKEVIKLLHDFPRVISESAETYNPGHIANYVYELAKEYNQFYHENPILKAEKEEEKKFRLALSEKTAEAIKTSLKLLGINAPERM